MAVSRRHVLAQGPVVRALVRAAFSAGRPGSPATVPGPLLEQTVPARSPALVRDYVRHVGGDPAAYRTTVPAHLFPQWGFPLLTRAMQGLPYDLRRALNGGCRIEIRRPLPANEPLVLSARVENIDDNGARAVIQTRLTTGTRSAPDAVSSWMYAVVPLARGSGGKRERPTVPSDAHELGWWRLRPDDALDFAVLTGDFNPVHWIPAAARAAGFRNTILHGFSTLGRTIEALVRNRFAGDPARLASIDVKFVRPLVLPAEVGPYVSGHALWVGAGPGGPAFLTGTFEERDHV
jgi:hypothetical protein